MDFLKQNILWVLFTLSLILIIARYKYFDFLKKSKQKARFKRGIQLEQEAAQYLRKQGFSILNYQGDYFHNYKVDGVEHKAKMLIDYEVLKNGKRFLVEVKSGTKAISMKDSSTRRQVLEYAHAIESDGIYLLDMENQNMMLIEFNLNHSKTLIKSSASAIFYVLMFFCCIGAAAIPSWEAKGVFIFVALILCLFPNFIKRFFSLFS